MKKDQKVIENELEEESLTPEVTAEDLETSEISVLKAENQKLREDYLRAFADSENTKKRCAQEIEKNSKYAISSFGKNLLSVADNLQRAIASAGEDLNEECSSLLEGIKLTQTELMNVFAKFDIKKIESIGLIFDPNYHQVIQEVVDNKKEAGTIIAEIQTGYLINDRILRDAMVVVSKKA